MDEQKKRKIKTVDTEIGMKFIVGVEATQKIEKIPVPTIIEDRIIEEKLDTYQDEKENTNHSVSKSPQRFFSYGYINYLWYGLISVILALVLLYFFLKK